MKRNIDPAIIAWKRSAEGEMKAVYAERRIGKRHADMLRQFNQQSALCRWFETPQTLWRESRRRAKATLASAALARSALIAQIGQRVAPLRRINHARLRDRGPDAHLQLPVGDGNGWLVIPPAETKTNSEIRVRIDPDTVRMIKDYQRDYRELTHKAAGAAKNNPHRFPGTAGGEPELGGYAPGIGFISPGKFSTTFARHLKKYCRLRLCLHVMRHISGKVILDQDPSAMALAQVILGHRTIKTTQSYYAEVSAIVAQNALSASPREGHAPGAPGLGLQDQSGCGKGGKSLMTKRRVTLPPADWPADIRERLEIALADASIHQRRRLTQGMGRWVKAARDERLSPDLVTVALWRSRTAGLKQTGRDAVRQTVVAVFPAARRELFAEAVRKDPARSRDEKLAALIERNLARWPIDWRDRARPKLSIDPEGIDNGFLVQAWSPETIKGRIEYMSTHFEFCRAGSFPVDVTPATVRANLRSRQQRCAAGELRIGGTSVYLSQICGLACALWPERNWTWLKAVRDKMKKLACAHPSRNDGRVVDVVELRKEALAALERAGRAQERARTQRHCIAAHSRARTALGMLILAEAPIRVDSLAGLEIGRQLSADRSSLPQEKRGCSLPTMARPSPATTCRERLAIIASGSSGGARRRTQFGTRLVPSSWLRPPRKQAWPEWC